MSDAKTPALHPVRALRNLQVDDQAIAEGEEGEIRAELVPALVACGAVEDLDPRPAGKKAPAKS